MLVAICSFACQCLLLTSLGIADSLSNKPESSHPSGGNISLQAESSTSPIQRDSFNTLALLLLPLLCFIGLVGNAFVCVAISTDKRLQNVTNYFLFSLALADLLVCCIVMPLSVVVEVKRGIWAWSFQLCLLYVYSDIFLCTASIVHMSVISLDRYWGISQPLKLRNKSKTAIIIKIAIVWFTTIIISSPIAVLALHDQSNVLHDNQCLVHNRYYVVYGSTLSFLIPFFIMAITYARTTSLLKRQAGLLHNGKGTNGDCGGLRRSAPARKIGFTRSGSCNNGVKVSLTLANPPLMNTADNPRTTPFHKSSDANGDGAEATKRKIGKLKNRTSSYLSTIVSKVSRKASIHNSNSDLMNERKATRVLAVVFVCFFICWTPFFAANFVVGFCGVSCALPPWLGSLFLWLGYFSSTINPVIYTIFNKRFRQSFIRIIRGQCCRPMKTSTNSHYSRTHTMMPDTFTTNLERQMSTEENGIRIIRGLSYGDNTICRTNSSGSPSNGKIVAFRSLSEDDDNSPKRQQTPPSKPANRKHSADSAAPISRGNTDETTDEEESSLLSSRQYPLILHPSTPITRENNKIKPPQEPSESSMKSSLKVDGWQNMLDSTETMTSSMSTMQRSVTESYSSMGTSQLVTTRPLLLFHDGYVIGKDEKPQGFNIRPINSECSFALAHRKLSKEDETAGGSLNLIDWTGSNSEDEAVKKKSNTSDGPHLTLMSTNNSGRIYKETFL